MSPSTSKPCSQCAEVKPLDDFARAAAARDGRRAECKACQKAKRPRKKCATCGKTKKLHDAFNKDKARPDGRQTSCKVCQRKYRLNYKRKPRCKTCRRVLAEGEPECCANYQKRSRTAVTSIGTGRPGCIVRDGQAWVPDVAREEWIAHEVKVCSKCGIDQHLDTCLDCTSPVSLSKSTPIRPLSPCRDCGDWCPDLLCWHCNQSVLTG